MQSKFLDRKQFIIIAMTTRIKKKSIYIKEVYVLSTLVLNPKVL